jgi:hypothetical protein
MVNNGIDSPSGVDRMLIDKGLSHSQPTSSDDKVEKKAI